MKKAFLIFIPLIVMACSPNQQTAETSVSEKTDSTPVQTDLYDYHKQFSPAETDTLLTNLTTYIFRKPADATWETKFDSKFRAFFIENRNNFEIVYMHENADSSFYYYLLRDAQYKNGYTKRGVVGKFEMDTNLVLSNFEEIANTPPASDDKLKEIGLLFMNELVAAGNLEKYLSDKTKVEWPDGRLFYSKEKFEWRYVE
jgi:hypothetical protein